MATYDINQFETDPNKARARLAFRDFLCLAFPDAEQRSTLRAVHLSGPHRTEYEKVFRESGIPANHVYAVEEDSEMYRLFSAANYSSGDPINEHHSSLQDFLRLPGKPFDIVSMDFDRVYSRPVVESLDILFNLENPKISDNAVLYLNVQARRENRNAQKRLFMLSMLARDSAMLFIEDCQGAILDQAAAFGLQDEQFYQELDEAHNKITYNTHKLRHVSRDFIDSMDNAPNIRLSEYVRNIRTNIFFDVMVLASAAHLRSIPDSVLEKVIESSSFAKDLFNRAKKMQPDISWVSSEEILRDPAMFAFVYQLLPDTLYHSIIMNQGIHVEENWEIRGPALVNNYEWSWEIKDWKRIPYISASGCGMEGQVFHLQKPASSSLIERINSNMPCVMFSAKLLNLTQSKLPGDEIVFQFARRYLFGPKATRVKARESLQRFRKGQALIDFVDQNYNEVTRGIIDTVSHHALRLSEFYQYNIRLANWVSELSHIITDGKYRGLEKEADKMMENGKFPEDLIGWAEQKVVSELEAASLKEQPPLSKGDLPSKNQEQNTRPANKSERDAIRSFLNEGMSVDEIYEIFKSEGISRHTVQSVDARRKNPTWRRDKRMVAA